MSTGTSTAESAAQSRTLCILSREVIADLRAEGWRVSDVLSADSGHRAHQWADICEPGNLQSIVRTILLAWSEGVASIDSEAAARCDDRLRLPDKFECQRVCTPAGGTLLTRALHELLVASALLAFALSLPGEDPERWRLRRDAARENLATALIISSSPTEVAQNRTSAFRRRIGYL